MKLASGLESRLNPHSPARVNVPPLAANAHRSQFVEEVPNLIEMRVDDDGALKIDVSPHPIDLHSRQTVEEITLVVEARFNDGLPTTVCETPLFPPMGLIERTCTRSFHGIANSLGESRHCTLTPFVDRKSTRLNSS